MVLVDGAPISLGDLRVLMDIEAELRRIEETYFQEEVELTQEQAENLVAIYEQLLANGGFTLYNTRAADDLTFPSGVDQTMVISAEVSAAAIDGEYTVTVKLDKPQPKEDVTFSWRVFDGSVTAAGTTEDTGVIKAGATETTFTVQAGQAAGELDDGGQGAFVVQIYDVKNALFDNGRDSWTQAVRVQGQDALKYYEEQSVTLENSTKDGQTLNGLTTAVQYVGTWGDDYYREGNAAVLKILAGTDDLETIRMQYIEGDGKLTPSSHTVLEGSHTVTGLSEGEYTVTMDYAPLKLSRPAANYPAAENGAIQAISYWENNSTITATDGTNIAYTFKCDYTSPLSYNDKFEETDEPDWGASLTLRDAQSRDTQSVTKQKEGITYKNSYALEEANGDMVLSTSVSMSNYAFVDTEFTIPLDVLFFLPTVTGADGGTPTVTMTVQEETTQVTPAFSAPNIDFISGETVPITVDFGYPVILEKTDTIQVNGQPLQPVETGVATTHATYLYEVPEYGYASLTLQEVPAAVTGANQRELTIDLEKPGETYGQIGDTTLVLPRLTDTVGQWTADVTQFTYRDPGDGTDPYTAAVVDLTMTPPGETTFRELLMSGVYSADGENYCGKLALSTDGGKTLIPMQVHETIQTMPDGTAKSLVDKLTARIEIDITTLEDPTKDLSFVAELYETTRDGAAVTSQELLFGHYVSYDVDAPIPLTAEDIEAPLPDTWPKENVFVNAPPDDLQLSASVTGTGYTWTQLRWYSDDEDVARIDPTTGEVTLYGTGTVNFYIRAVNGDLEAYQDGTEDAPYAEDGDYSKLVATLTVGEGDAPYLRIPEDALTVRAGDDVTLRWAGNLVQKNMQYSQDTEPTAFTIQVYQGGPDEDGQPAGELIQTVKFTYDPKQPGATFPGTVLPMWSGEGETLTPIQSYTLTGLNQISIGNEPSYTLVLTASTSPDVPGGPQTFTDSATVTVVSQPVTVELERPKSFYLVNQGTLELEYVLNHYDAGNDAQFKLTVTDNGTGRPVVSLDETESTEGGVFTIDLADAKTDGFRAIYDVSLQAKNTAEPDWSRDSFTLYIYDKDCLDLVVKEMDHDRVVVDGDSVFMSNEDWIASLSQDEIIALNREIDLQTTISIN